ncbi:MAG: (Na+)-NQR maturation NqrM [Gammaproteobacteria bacterium]|nr:(Na+)-NQR maturation NqrM [Gammaproteobacteria bacterium]
MAVGVAFGRKPISGSCGGLRALGGNAACEICGENPEFCDRSN